MNPSISVIIPVFNREHQIGKAIESVMAQSFSDWELIVVDDCSTDGTHQSIKSFTDPRIKIIKTLNNSGAATARNLGIVNSNSELISFLDSDDVLEPLFIELSLKKFNSVSSNVAMIWTGCRFFRGASVVESTWKPDLKNPYYAFLLNLSIGTNSGITIRKNVFKTLGTFDEALPAAEDTDLFLRISQAYLVDYLDMCLINIHQIGNDRLSRKFEKIAIAYNQILPKHLQTIQKHRSLRLKFYYKLMWLNYHLDDKKLARYYFKLILKDRVWSFKIWFVFILFELFGQTKGVKLHIMVSGLARQ